MNSSSVISVPRAKHSGFLIQLPTNTVTSCRSHHAIKLSEFHEIGCDRGRALPEPRDGRTIDHVKESQPTKQAVDSSSRSQGWGKRPRTKRSFEPRKPRGGFTVIECLVGCGLLIVTASALVTVSRQVDSVLHGIRHEQVARNELNNQLTSILSAGPGENRPSPSAWVIDRLDNPQLSLTESTDPLGKRITVTLTWQGRFTSQSLSMSGWKPRNSNLDAEDQ